MDSVSIVIPAYNEERRLPSTLEDVAAYLDRKRFGFSEIIVVDDGSRDRTAALVENSKHRGLRLLRNPGNRGKGYTVRHGMLEAAGEWILYTDADLSAPIEEMDKLLDAVRREDAQVAIGSRALDRSLVGVHQSAFREMSGRAFNLVMRGITGLPFLDTQCGFKLFRADAAQAIFSRQTLDGFSFDVEDLVIAKKLGIKAIEVPVVWNNVEGTKVSAFSGAASFAALIGIRWKALSGAYAVSKPSRQ
ncbi:MAG TPA: dolichyl-phosphate beta-glucosyltransferase [Bryobacteraceae bacterium]|nr:dolichyl-phosphate beta-glucosyltransferase [Bryobacteraceae bacterium]